jgi:DNA-binding CsgD family transcriptional regulator
MAIANVVLVDKEWVKSKYVDEQLSTLEIAKLAGARASTVSRALERFGIPKRSRSLANKLRKRKFKSVYLNDTKWLEQKYIAEQLNSYQIAELAGTNQRSVLFALQKAGIKTRTVSESKKLQHELCPVESRFSLLNDKSWLEQRYVVEHKSSEQIAKEIGCNGGNVIAWLKRYGIKRRDNVEASKYVEHFSSYEELNNRNWLEKKYVDEKLGTKKIAKLIGVKTPNSVRQFLMKFDIPVRNISDGLTCNREDDGWYMDQPVFDGSMLGDASMKSYNRRSDESYPYFFKTNKFQDHIEFVAKKLFPITFLKRVSPKLHKGNGKECIYYFVSSNAHDFLLPIYRKWYPPENNYKKLVPQDIVITAETLLHWFLDDGYSYLRKRPTKQVIIGLCTESFSKEDNMMLIEKIKQSLGLVFSIRKTKGGTGWRLILPQLQANTFFEIIGPPPVASLAYKWK